MIKLKDLIFEKKVKPMQKISKKEWSKIKKFNKHIGQDGTYYVMQLTNKGTALVPVVVEEKLKEQISSFNAIQDKLVDLGFGNLVVSWRGTKKKVKDLKPGNRIDNITLEKTNNTLLKSKSMSYDGNDYKVTPQGKKHFKGTLKLEGKLTEKEFIPTVTIEFTRENRGKGKTEVKKFKTIADAKKYTKQMNKKYKLKRQKGFWGNPVNGIELFHNFS